MLKFNKITFIFLVLFLIAITYDSKYELSFLIYIIILSSYLSFLIYGSARINSNFYVETLCKAKTNNNDIAISFDDGPDKLRTENILEILDEYKVQAAFFMIGKKDNENKEIVKRIYNSSHLIGGHSFSHSMFFGFFSTLHLINEFKETEDLIFDCIGKRIQLFRPPFGVTNPSLKKAVRFMHYICIGWSVRSLDSSQKGTQKILSRIKIKLTPGAIILLHDTTENIGELLRELLLYLKQNNYNVVRLDKLLSINAYK